MVGILAHVDSGKTTLSEAMLYRAGSIRKLGRVDNKDAFLDTDTLEKARGITIFSKQALLKTGRRISPCWTPPAMWDFFHRDGAHARGAGLRGPHCQRDGRRAEPYRDALASAAAISYPDLRLHQ